MDLRYRARSYLRSSGWDFVRFNPEADRQSFLPMLLTHFGVSLVVDAGAADGTFSRLLRRHGFRGRIAAFEPNPDNVLKLRKAAARDPLWDVYPFALGSTPSRLPLSGDGYVSSLRTFSPFGRKMFQGARPDYSREVEVKRLADVGLTRAPTFIKTDTQGYDLEVVRGACLDDVVGMQLEMSVIPIYEGQPSYQEAIDELESLGFVLSQMFPVVRDDRMRLIEFDAVFVRA